MKKYGKISLVLVVVLATILISGCIGGDSNNKFTKEVTVEGVTFYLPSDFDLDNKKDNVKNVAYFYSDGTNAIAIYYYPGASKDLIISQLKDSSEVTNVNEDVSFGGISGHTAEGKVSKVFVFEKSGKTFAIEMSDTLNFEEYVPKILG